MRDLKNIVDEVKSLKTKDFNPTDDMILDCSTRILLSGSAPKSQGTKSTQRKSFKIKDPTAPATDAQKGKLDELGIKYPAEINKGEASKLIEENADY